MPIRWWVVALNKPAGFNARLGTSFGTGRESFTARCAICKDSTYTFWNKHPMSPKARPLHQYPTVCLREIPTESRNSLQILTRSGEKGGNFLHRAAHQLVSAPVPCLCPLYRTLSGLPAVPGPHADPAGE